MPLACAIASNSGKVAGERAAAFLTNPAVHRVVRLMPLRPGLVVLNYHRIAPDAGPPLDRGLWSATPQGFAAQLERLQRDFDVIALDELAPAIDAAGPAPVLAALAVACVLGLDIERMRVGLRTWNTPRIPDEPPLAA